MSATINVINGTNVRATVGIYGFSSGGVKTFISESLPVFFEAKLFKPRSFTFIYAPNNTASRDRMVSLGQRQLNDKLLYFKSKIVRKSNRFAEDDFHIYDSSRFLTKVTFSFSVSSMCFYLSIVFINNTLFF